MATSLRPLGTPVPLGFLASAGEGPVPQHVERSQHLVTGSVRRDQDFQFTRMLDVDLTGRVEDGRGVGVAVGPAIRSRSESGSHVRPPRPLHGTAADRERWAIPASASGLNAWHCPRNGRRHPETGPETSATGWCALRHQREMRAPLEAHTMAL